MKLIIPMAGNGKRMRPHTLTTPKPLITIAGKPIVERLIVAINDACPEKITHIAFVGRELNEEQRAMLESVASSIAAQAMFYEQAAPLGTAHAIFCAAPLLEGPVIIAFPDTIFTTKNKVDTTRESVIFVKKVANPAEFGVVQLSEKNIIQGFIEKPQQFVGDLAIIGVYYFRKGLQLKQSLQSLLAISVGGEYELTTALEGMCKGGTQFTIHEVDAWLDCGNKRATIHTNKQVLATLQGSKNLIDSSLQLNNSVIIPPVYIGKGVKLYNTVLGPDVSVGNHTTIHDSRIKNSLIQAHTHIRSAHLDTALLGNYVHFGGTSTSASIGDYTTVGTIDKI